jgi:hypothetical protein
MSEERPQHPQEPAEGAEEAEEAPGVEKAGDDGGMPADDEERSVEHPQEPAEGAEEAEEAPGGGSRRSRGSPWCRASRRRPLAWLLVTLGYSCREVAES